MKSINLPLFKKHKLSLVIPLALGLFSGYSYAGCTGSICTDYTIWGNGDYGDNLSITNTLDFTVSPTNAVVGIYKNAAGEIKVGNNLTLNISGSQADAIQTKSGSTNINNPAVITIGDYATIRATGSSADAINVGNNKGSATVTLGSDAYIYSLDGIAVRANLAGADGQFSNIIIGDRANIVTMATGQNSSDSKGYGVYAGNRELGETSAQKGSALASIGKDSTITTSGSSAHAVFANKGGVIKLGDGTSIITNGANANGLNAQAGTLFNSTGGIIEVLGGLNITVNGNGSNAIYATGNSSSIKSYDSVNAQATSGVFTIDGNMRAERGGVIDLSFANGSVFSGATQSRGSTSGTINLALTGANSVWNVTSDSTLTSLSLLNGATLNYIHDNPSFKTVTVTGNYHGDNGLIIMNALLADDNSPSNELIIEGNTSGTTYVKINNAGGLGDATLNGIPVIKVLGQSDGEFIQTERITAGSYDYVLYRGSNNPLLRADDTANWYLHNGLYFVIDPLLPPEYVEARRPEPGSYIANLSAANNMFTTRLHDRLGETQYIDVLTGEQRVTSMWMRNEGGHNRWRDSSGQLDTQSNRYVLQLGGDIAQWSTNNLDRWHLGLMAGYGKSSNNTVASTYGYQSKGSVDGYSVGVYGTWYANNEDKSGLYVDSWAQYGWFNNTINGEGIQQEKYNSSGVTASLESGYTFKIGEKNNINYFIQPKAQAIWMGIKSDDHKEHNGTNVSGKGDGNIQTRVGVKAYLQGHSQIDNGKDRVFQPFVEANWIHNSKDFAVQMDGNTSKQDGAKNIGELKLGLEGQINKKLNIWGNVGQQVGDKSYRDTAVMLGVKYNF